MFFAKHDHLQPNPTQLGHTRFYLSQKLLTPIKSQKKKRFLDEVTYTVDLRGRILQLLGSTFGRKVERRDT